MTDLRQAAQQALEALETKGEHHPRVYAAITALRTALEQQAEPPPEWPLIKNILAVFGLDAISFVAKWQAAQQQAEPVSQAVIAGALFDFMGWLTTRKERLILSSTDNASPAADAIKVFAEMRGLSLDDARVQDWQNYTTQQQVEPTCPDCKAAVLYECVACSSNNYPPKQQAEPVATVTSETGNPNITMSWWHEPALPVGTKLYTAPPQRQWVGLTDEEILSTDPWEILRADPWMGTSDSNINPYQILLKVRTLEAKLKERNT